MTQDIKQRVEEELHCIAVNDVPYILFRQYVELENRIKDLSAELELAKSDNHKAISNDNDYANIQDKLEEQYNLFKGREERLVGALKHYATVVTLVEDGNLLYTDDAGGVARTILKDLGINPTNGDV